MCGNDPHSDTKRSFSIAVAGYFPLKILFPSEVAVNVCLSHSRVLQDNDLRAVKRHSLEGLPLLKHLYVPVLSSSWQAERPWPAHCWRRQWLTLSLGPCCCSHPTKVCFAPPLFQATFTAKFTGCLSAAIVASGMMHIEMWCSFHFPKPNKDEEAAPLSHRTLVDL